MRKYEVTFQDRLKDQARTKYRKQRMLNGKRLYSVREPDIEDYFITVSFAGGSYKVRMSYPATNEKWLTREDAMMLKLQGYTIKELKDIQ